jgi:hypothetical protein
MRIIYCCPIQLGGEFSNCTGFLPPYSFPLPLPSSLPFSMPALGGCQILTLEAPLITEKAPCMYIGYLYSKDDVRSPFGKPPWQKHAIQRINAIWLLFFCKIKLILTTITKNLNTAEGRGSALV